MYFGSAIHLFRSEIFRRVNGFNIDNRTHFDGELFIDMALAGARFALGLEFWSRFRIHDEGMTGSGRLYELFLKYQDRMFRRIMGREPHRWDRLLGIGARCTSRMFNLSDTAERLRRGAI